MKKILLYVVSALVLPLSAQDTLTIDDALALALKNNHDILLAENETALARTNNSWSAVGAYPTVAAVASADYAFNNVRQKQSAGNEVRYPAQNSIAWGAGVEFAWAITEGGKMFITKEKFSQIQSLGEIGFRSQVSETMSEVIAAYYDVVRQQQRLVSICEMISYNQERVKITDAGFRAGSQRKTDLLQAKIDLNVTREDSILQVDIIRDARRTLNNLLGRDVEIVFEVAAEIPLNYQLNRTEMLDKLDKNNTDLLAAQKMIEIAGIALRENRHSYYPSLSLRGGMYVAGSAASEGGTLRSLTFGPQIGATLNVPIYQGGEIKRKAAVARLEQQAAEYDLGKLKLQLFAQMQSTLNDFENQQRLLEIEEENILLTKENLSISLQRFRLGQSLSLEVHQAQESYVQSATRLINFKYNLKIAETQLRRLISAL